LAERDAQKVGSSTCGSCFVLSALLVED
jgi:hypothetical protein